MKPTTSWDIEEEWGRVHYAVAFALCAVVVTVFVVLLQPVWREAPPPPEVMAKELRLSDGTHCTVFWQAQHSGIAVHCWREEGER